MLRGPSSRAACVAEASIFPLRRQSPMERCIPLASSCRPAALYSLSSCSAVQRRAGSFWSVHAMNSTSSGEKCSLGSCGDGSSCNAFTSAQ